MISTGHWRWLGMALCAVTGFYAIWHWTGGLTRYYQADALIKTMDRQTLSRDLIQFRSPDVRREIISALGWIKPNPTAEQLKKVLEKLEHAVVWEQDGADRLRLVGTGKDPAGIAWVVNTAAKNTIAWSQRKASPSVWHLAAEAHAPQKPARTEGWLRLVGGGVGGALLGFILFGGKRKKIQPIAVPAFQKDGILTKEILAQLATPSVELPIAPAAPAVAEEKKSEKIILEEIVKKVDPIVLHVITPLREAEKPIVVEPPAAVVPPVLVSPRLESAESVVPLVASPPAELPVEPPAEPVQAPTTVTSLYREWALLSTPLYTSVTPLDESWPTAVNELIEKTIFWVESEGTLDVLLRYISQVSAEENTVSHVIHVALITLAWCWREGLPNEETRVLIWAALVHDVALRDIPAQELLHSRAARSRDSSTHLKMITGLSTEFSAQLMQLLQKLGTKRGMQPALNAEEEKAAQRAAVLTRLDRQEKILRRRALILAKQKALKKVI